MQYSNPYVILLLCSDKHASEGTDWWLQKLL